MSSEQMNHRRGRLRYVRALNNRTERLDLSRVEKYKEAIWNSYRAATVCSQVASIEREPSAEPYGFRSIGLRSSIQLDEFNAKDYYWEPYFSDVGRVVARGERRYLHQRLARQVRGGDVSISRSSPDFQVLTDSIRQLASEDLQPDTLLAPVQLMVSFVKFFFQQMNWPPEGKEQLRVEDCSLKILWSHRYAPLRSLIIFNSRAGIWHVIPDPDSGRTVTIALGESSQPMGRVEYWVETLVHYEITRRAAFRRINLTS